MILTAKLGTPWKLSRRAPDTRTTTPSSAREPCPQLSFNSGNRHSLSWRQGVHSTPQQPFVEVDTGTSICLENSSSHKKWAPKSCIFWRLGKEMSWHLIHAPRSGLALNCRSAIRHPSLRRHPCISSPGYGRLEIWQFNMQKKRKMVYRQVFLDD